MKMLAKVLKIGIPALMLLFVFQLVTINLQASEATGFASWVFQPASLEEAVAEANTVVMARVVAVETGKPIVHDAEGNEPGGAVVIPTQLITLEVVKSLAGESRVGQKLSLFQTGGERADALEEISEEEAKLQGNEPVLILEGDPFYVVGEEYLLMLTAGPDGLLRTVSPEGRFLVNKDGSLTAMVDNAMTQSVVEQGLDGVERQLAEQR